MDRTERIFVYGTLRTSSGHPMAELLARSSQLLGPAKVRGQLHDLGDYPGLRLPGTALESGTRPGGAERSGAPESGPWVLGELHELADPSLWEVLDRYEGCGTPEEPGEFRRLRGTALREDGTSLDCWLYEAVHLPAGAPRIPHGDWLRHRRGDRSGP